MSKPIDAVCPECEYPVDSAAVVFERAPSRPEPGDLALCIRCSAPSFYVDNGETLGLRLPTIAEKVQLFEDEAVMEVREKIQEVSGPWLP